MPKYTFTTPVTFAFDVDAETEDEARALALVALDSAINSDKWCAPDVDAEFPRLVRNPRHANSPPTLEEVYDDA